jgi:ABC-2 type transport system permease protein
LSAASGRGGGLPEAIVVNYIISFIPVVVHMFFVPALTMRLLSEEQRSGTLEVMLTAPVNEVSVVIGKFLAAWIFYNLLWLPWWIFLVSLRYFGNEEFDYRPILSFNVALAVISAGFISMGLFCSSLTSNQIVAAVFTFVGMMTHLALYFSQGLPWFSSGPIAEAMQYVNFIDLWIESLRGTIAPRYLVFHLSLTIFFLFATVKVLEARKWK